MDLFEQARQNLTAAVLAIAGEVAVASGFGFTAVEDAPSTFEAVVEAHAQSVATGAVFPIWNGASDDCVYTLAEGNFAFRFWHDVRHAEYGLTFSADDELLLATHQLAELQRFFAPGSKELELFYFDTIGQTRYGSEVGGFVGNQLRFVRNCCDHGLIEAIAWEASFVRQGL